MSDDEDDYMSDKFLPILDDVRASLILTSLKAKKPQVNIDTKKHNNIKSKREEKSADTNEQPKESLKKPISQDNNVMSDDEDDYMSDKFLPKLDEVRPSLILSRAKKRQVNIETKKHNNIKRQREERGADRNEQLQESLKKSISQDNKGFQMLAKMGYKPGQALGKKVDTNEEKNTKIDNKLIEPIPISIKEGRGGLGRDAALRELNEKRKELRHQRLLKKLGGNEPLSTEEFRKRANAKAQERFFAGALKGCQKTCENLDVEAGVESPEMLWFWPERLQEENEEQTADAFETLELETDEVDYTPEEKLEMLTRYLRTAYNFCFWCGVKYNDMEDLNSNCPGLTRDEH